MVDYLPVAALCSEIMDAGELTFGIEDLLLLHLLIRVHLLY